MPLANVQDEPMWQIAKAPYGMGSYDFPSAGGSSLYAGPNPNVAPECEADNYLGLKVDSAPAGAKIEGCFVHSMKNPALAGVGLRHTKMEAKVNRGIDVFSRGLEG